MSEEAAAAAGDTGTEADAQPTGDTSTKTTEPTTPTFFEALPDDLRNNEAFKDMQGPEDLANAYLDVSNKVPNVPEQYVPPDGYDIADQKTYDGFVDFAKEHNLPQETFEAGLKFYESTIDSQVESHNMRVEAAAKELQQQYGDNFQTVQQSVKSVAERLVPGLSDNDNVMSDPQAFHAFAKISELVSEDTFGKIEAWQPQKGVKVDQDGVVEFEFKGLKG